MTDQEISARKLTRVVPTRKNKRGRMPGISKLQILSQDLIRHMMNICDEVSQEERNKAVDSYTDRLIRSGNYISQVRDIIVSVLTGYERKKLKAAKEKAPLH